MNRIISTLLLVIATLFGNAQMWPDVDGDGLGDNSSPQALVLPLPTGFVLNGNDCDDSDFLSGLIQTYYLDYDGDGFGDINESLAQCTQPAGFVLNSLDCDDFDATIPNVYYQDNDGDGFGCKFPECLDFQNPELFSLVSCTPVVGYVTNDNDCNDSDPLQFPDIVYLDMDGDGYGTGNPMYDCFGLGFFPNPSALIAGDCNDFNPWVNPENYWYEDQDNDGYGDLATEIQTCLPPLGYVNNSLDCDDSNALDFPLQYCIDLDGDGYGNNTDLTGDCLWSCSPVAGYVTNYSDCDDTAPLFHFYSVYHDDDMDGYGDLFSAATCFPDLILFSNYSYQNGDCNDNDPLITPENYWYEDQDNDGFGDLATEIQICNPPQGYVPNGLDCNNANASINPLAIEICGNGIDDNCDGFAQDNLNPPFFTQALGDYHVTALPGLCGTVANYPALDYDDVDQCNQNLSLIAVPPSGSFFMLGTTVVTFTITDGVHFAQSNFNLIVDTASEICNNGIDDDCDGQTDENCVPPPANDNRANAQIIGQNLNVYPSCNIINSTLLGATASPEANSIAPTGEDVWYRFTAISSAITISASPIGFDVMIELQKALGVTVDIENSTAATSTETLNYVGLTIGTQYYIAVRVVNSAGGILPSSFNLCLRHLISSYCADGSGTYDLCSNFKPKWTGANGYQFQFAPTGVTPGVPTFATSASQIPLSTVALNLQHGGTYDVAIHSIFNLQNALGAEVVIVPEESVCNVLIASHASVEVKVQQRCMAILQKNSVMQGKPFVCGAQYFKVEFTRVNNCSAAMNIGLPFVVSTVGASNAIALNFLLPQPLLNNSYYSVRYKPVFANGDGNFGNPQVIFIGGVAQETSNMEQMNIELKTTLHNSKLELYPNPYSSGDLHFYNQQILDENVDLNLYDKMGRIVYSTNLLFDQTGHSMIKLPEGFNQGLYLIELRNSTTIFVHRLHIQY